MELKKPKKPPKGPTQGTFVRIPEELKDWIITQAEKENRNISNMIITLLQKARNEQKEKSQ